MYRISVTTLEKFRRVKLGLTSFDTEEALIETIRGVFEGNDKTRIGGAFHKIIEGEYHINPVTDYIYADNFAFSPDQAAPALAYRDDHQVMVHELAVSKIYELEKYSIKVSGRVDGIEGLHVRDPKTKFKRPDFQEYIDSFQWRFYLEMLNLNVFYYDVFEVQGFDTIQGKAPYHLSGVEFLEAQDVQCLRYPGMTHECQNLLREFMEYIERKKFFHLLKQEQVTPPALQS